MKRSIAAFLFGLLLIPSAWIAWRNREMPQLGRTHDDAIHYITAKSLAEGHGYRIQNMPGAPYETKYPPLLPWLLAGIYRVNPVFPGNLRAMAALEWAFIPLFLWLSLLWFRRVGLSRAQLAVALVLLAASPYTVALGAGLNTEVIFSCFLLASLLLCGDVWGAKRDWRWAIFSGALAGLAFFTRTAGLVALVSMPTVLFLGKKNRAALGFMAGMLPFVLGWLGWARMHKNISTDLAWIYNTDYLGYLFAGVHGWKDLGLMVWKNFAYVPDSMGAVVFPMELGTMLYQMLRTTVAVGIIAGLWRNRRSQQLWPYIAFAAVTLAELAMWTTSNLRLMYPLMPLFIAGAIWEGTHIWGAIRSALRHRERSQRVAAWMMAGAVALFAGAAVFMHGYMDLRQLPDKIRDDEEVRRQNLAAYQWIEQNTPPDARLVANNPALYLYTGRQNVPVVLPVIYWYREDKPSALAIFRDLPSFAQKHDLTYLFLSDSDYQAAATPDLAADARAAVESSAALRSVFRYGAGTVLARSPFRGRAPANAEGVLAAERLARSPSR